MEDILPCNCGRNPRMEHYTVSMTWTWSRVSCDGCGFGKDREWGRDDEQAVQMWNERQKAVKA